MIPTKLLSKPWFKRTPLVRHAICILALMWTGIVNGQPFFFPDTTNYIRAADLAAHLASGRQWRSAWTERYENDLSQRVQGDRSALKHRSPNVDRRNSSNDLSTGNVMAGRSPYLGAAMYVAYLISNFWLFVIAQAALAYLLIVLAIQRIGLADHAVTPIVLFLSVTTALPTYNSLLLADAFASFGILSFLLLATPGKLSRKKTVGLTAVLCASSMFHLTHIMMLLGMVGALSAVSFLNIAPVALTRAAATGAIGLIAGVLSIQATSVVTTMVLGRPPQLLPLLTARFVADGPGLSYIDSECEKRFQVCRVRIGRDLNNATFLFSPDVAHGTYALLNSEERSRMGREDTQFALAVWKSYPLDESYMIFRNTVRQIAWIDYDGLNQNCFANSNCWNALPTNVRQTLRRSLSGRGMWPQQAMNFLLYVVVLGSICYLVVNYRHFQKLAPETEKVMRMWLIIGGAAMVVCAVFGGAVADPQYRYQGRLIWLIPLFAALIFLKSRSLVYIGRRQDSI